MNKQSKFYRKKAQEMRELARRATDAKLCIKLNEVADEYDRLAGEVERPAE